MDFLSQILQLLRLESTVYFRANFCSPWGMSINAGKFANFHVVTSGQCWFSFAGGAPTPMNAGDLLLFPRGDSHRLTHNPDGNVVPAGELLAQPRVDDQGVSFGGNGVVTTLICGHFSYDRQAPHPLFETLPAMIHLKSGGRQDVFLQTAVELALRESESSKSGSSAVINRLGEVLLIQALRTFLEQETEPKGFISILSAPPICQAIQMLHDQPSRGWTLHELASGVGLSRSALAEQFKKRVGVSPMAYLTHWRMLMARDLLKATELPMVVVAEQVGYDSEFAFARAFKRTLGVTPGRVRRDRRRETG